MESRDVIETCFLIAESLRNARPGRLGRCGQIARSVYEDAVDRGRQRTQ
jgi:hypothetical protein